MFWNRRVRSNMTIPVRPPKPLATRTTIAHLLLDASGSMQNGKAETMQAFNTYIRGLRGQDIRFTLSQFNTKGVKVISENVPPSDVRQLNDETYLPDGGTPLYDAIAYTIQQAEEQAEERVGSVYPVDAVLIIIQTDGEENSSQQWRRNQIKELIEEKTGQGWQFVYLGKGINAMVGGRDIGADVVNHVAHANQEGAVPASLLHVVNEVVGDATLAT